MTSAISAGDGDSSVGGLTVDGARVDGGVVVTIPIPVGTV
jgi:hypothetical protein